jgi:hypothetical protein
MEIMEERVTTCKAHVGNGLRFKYGRRDRTNDIVKNAEGVYNLGYTLFELQFLNPVNVNFCFPTTKSSPAFKLQEYHTSI